MQHSVKCFRCWIYREFTAINDVDKIGKCKGVIYLNQNIQNFTLGLGKRFLQDLQ